MKKKHLIKKYLNRRLYDTTRKTYITLEEIKKLVLDHEEFKVIDAHTKKDITQATLLQIILEQEGSSHPLFTIEILQDFIRFYQEKSQNVFSQYLQLMLNLFAEQKDFFKSQLSPKKPSVEPPQWLEQWLEMQRLWSHHIKKTMKPGKKH